LIRQHKLYYCEVTVSHRKTVVCCLLLHGDYHYYYTLTTILTDGDWSTVSLTSGQKNRYSAKYAIRPSSLIVKIVSL